jgi:phosphoketolase
VLVHAFGAVMDNPNLIALAVDGDGEAEKGLHEGSGKGISFSIQSVTERAIRSHRSPAWSDVVENTSPARPAGG